MQGIYTYIDVLLLILDIHSFAPAYAIQFSFIKHLFVVALKRAMVQARRTTAEAELCVTSLWLRNKGSWRAALYVGQEPTGTV